MKSIKSVIRNVPAHWVGDGFPVRSLFSYNEGERYDPFLLLDYAGPHEFQPGQAKRGVGEHPHKGFETVTIVSQGEVDHGDSTGSHGTIGPGDVQWMTAASGIVHEEFHSENFTRTGGVLEMIQLWVNLPAKDKVTPPKYQSIVAQEIPQVSLNNDAGFVRVIAGDFRGTTGAASTFTPINAWEVHLTSGAQETISVPDGHTALLVIQAGTVRVNGTDTTAAELVEFERSGTEIQLESNELAKLLVLTGLPIGEPVVGYGPFVMNTKDEIRQAMEDFRAGRMGSTH